MKPVEKEQVTSAKTQNISNNSGQVKARALKAGDAQNIRSVQWQSTDLCKEHQANLQPLGMGQCNFALIRKENQSTENMAQYKQLRIDRKALTDSKSEKSSGKSSPTAHNHHRPRWRGASTKQRGGSLHIRQTAQMRANGRTGFSRSGRLKNELG